MPFALKMRRVRQIAARLANIVARWEKSAAISYPGASRTNHESGAQFLIKKRHTNLTNCCFLFDVYCSSLSTTQSSSFVYFSDSSIGIKYFILCSLVRLMHTVQLCFNISKAISNDDTDKFKTGLSYIY